MATAKTGTKTTKYEYNADGLRTRKTNADGTSVDYFIVNGTTVAERWNYANGSEYFTMRYTFDENGSVIGFSTHYPNFTNGYWEDYLFAKNLQGDVVAMYLITVEPPKLVATYEYDEWGKVKTVRDATGAILTNPAHLANRNPFRYRSYHYDIETGFYYLQSRYYDPAISRFINADSYGSTGQGFLGTNMFAYCANNPCNNIDPTGHSWKDIWEFVEIAISEMGKTVKSMELAYAGCGGVAVVDGPLPIGDVIGIVGAAVLTLAAAGVGVYQAVQIKIQMEDEKEKYKKPAPESSPTVIYRYGGTNPGNLTPSQRDVDMFPITGKGLSFSTIPKPGAAMTTIEALNATGVVYAVRDGANHVSVFPVGGTLADWHNAGSMSAWTAAIKSVVVKWGGGN